jgi:hypothetical protein
MVLTREGGGRDVPAGTPSEGYVDFINAEGRLMRRGANGLEVELKVTAPDGSVVQTLQAPAAAADARASEGSGTSAVETKASDDAMSLLQSQMAEMMRGMQRLQSEMSRDKHTAARGAVETTAAKPEKEKGLRITEATKVYKSHLAAVLVKKPGDGNFPAAELCWRRLVRDYPVDPEDRRKLVACAFEGAAAQEFERVSALHLDLDDTSLWALMRDRLYNPAQVQAVRSRFASAKVAPGEAIEVFANRLRQMAGGLPETVGEDALLQRFRDGLPRRLKLSALTMSGGYDDIVSRVSQIDAALILTRSVEGVNEIMDEPLPTRPNRGTRENPVGPNPDDPDASVPEWLREKLCYRCEQYGHLARGRTSCGWPRKERSGPGNGAGEGNPRSM